MGLQHKMRTDKIKAMLADAAKARGKDIIKWYNYTKIATIAEDVMMSQKQEQQYRTLYTQPKVKITDGPVGQSENYQIDQETAIKLVAEVTSVTNRTDKVFEKTPRHAFTQLTKSNFNKSLASRSKKDKNEEKSDSSCDRRSTPEEKRKPNYVLLDDPEVQKQIHEIIASRKNKRNEDLVKFCGRDYTYKQVTEL